MCVHALYIGDSTLHVTSHQKLFKELNFLYAVHFTVYAIHCTIKD